MAAPIFSHQKFLLLRRASKCAMLLQRGGVEALLMGSPHGVQAAGARRLPISDIVFRRKEIWNVRRFLTCCLAYMPILSSRAYRNAFLNLHSSF